MGDILILNNRINKIAEPGTISAEGTVIDGKGKFLMPGLIDAHWHSYMCCNTMIDLLTAESSYTQLKAGVEAGKTLMRGFTTIRDAGGPVFGLKRAIDGGIIPGCRFIQADLSFLKPEDMVISGLYMTIPDLSAVVV